MTKEQYIKEVEERTGLDILQPLSTRENRDRAERAIRDVAVYYLFKHFGIKQKALGLLFKVTYKCISRWVVKTRKRKRSEEYIELLRLLDPKL